MGSDWKKLLLKEVCSKIGSGATPRGGNSVYLSEGEYSLIRSQNVRNDSFAHNGLAFIKKSHADKLSNVTVEKEDVLLNITGDSVARCCQVDPSVLPARVNQHVAIIRPTPEILDAQYLRYYMVSPLMQNEMLSMAGIGATRNALTKGMIDGFEIPLPPLPEQKAIAHILGSLDDKIELNRRMNATLEGMAQALFKSWFTDFDPVVDNILMKNMAEYLDQNQPSSPLLPGGEELSDPKKSLALWERLGEGAFKGIPEEFATRAETRRLALADGTANREAAKAFPDSFQETEKMGWIPDGWEVSTFGDVALAIRDSVNPSSLDADVPYVGLEHIGRKQMYLSDWGCAEDVDSNKSAFQKGDVLFGKLRPYFHKVCIMNFSGVCSTDILVFRAKEDCWSGFVQYQLFNEKFVEYANARSTGTRMPRASWKDMVAYLIAKPCGDVAARFARLVECFNAKALLNVESASKLAKLRDTLLPKVISGELRIEDAEDLIKEEK
ncbi:MAG: restriction endonuclease subunit S [Kiritimatiellae bacterium]|jgi:type I restriction enzyme S subunit|nr:restriction endonuclease subunit S [Kiritimatiellia bacterium]